MDVLFERICRNLDTFTSIKLFKAHVHCSLEFGVASFIDIVPSFKCGDELLRDLCAFGARERTSCVEHFGEGSVHSVAYAAVLTSREDLVVLQQPVGGAGLES
ncbi:MAG: hypothetical protein ACTH9H_03255 [Galactobacter sp.]